MAYETRNGPNHTKSFASRQFLAWSWEAIKLVIATMASAWLATSVMVARLDERSSQVFKDQDHLRAQVEDLQKQLIAHELQQSHETEKIMEDCRRLSERSGHAERN